MKLSATTADASTATQLLKAISLESKREATEDRSLFTTIVARFWAYTEETGKADTKSFEGLL